MEEMWVTHDAELKEPPLEQLYPKALCAMMEPIPFKLLELGFLPQIRMS